MRPKEEISNLTTLYNVDSRPSFISSRRSSVLCSSDADSPRPRNGFINFTNSIFVAALTQGPWESQAETQGLYRGRSWDPISIPLRWLSVAEWFKDHSKYHFWRHSFQKIKSSWIWISRGDSIRSITKWVWTSHSKFCWYNETRNFWTSVNFKE